jgi:hypothetical protein
MLAGNVQWARVLLPACLRRNPVAAIVALRRLFRVFWAWWAVFLAAGLALAFRDAVLPAAAAAVLMAGFSRGVRQLVGAALVSLSAPAEMLRGESLPGRAWR